MIPADPQAVVVAARAWIGTPYHDQASVRGVGCDCLGLARGVWREVVGPEPFPLPPYSRDWGEVGAREVLAEGAARLLIPAHEAPLAHGLLLLFRMKERGPAKHLGILTDPDHFVHACERIGVVEERLTRAWSRRITRRYLFPAPTEEG